MNAKLTIFINFAQTLEYGIMNLYIISFSPTGTSARVAAALAQGLSETGCTDVVTLDCTRAPLPAVTLGRTDLAVVAAPVYGGKMAPLAKKRMESIKGDSTPCVLLCLYGNRAFEQAPADMADMARARGLVPVAAAAFIGEHSYSTPQTPIAAGRPDSDDLEQARRFGTLIAASLRQRGPVPVDAALMRDEPSSPQSIANFRSFVAEYQRSRQENPKPLLPELDATLCNGCGLCASICPAGAIDPDTLAVDPAHCIKCCACVKCCERGARSLASPFAPVLSANYAQRKRPSLLLPS